MDTNVNMLRGKTAKMLKRFSSGNHRFMSLNKYSKLPLVAAT